MAKTRKTILKNYTDIVEEFVAAAALSPGHVLEITSAGKVQKHSVGAGNVTPIIVAVENSMMGNDVDDAYAANDVVQTAILRAGDRFQGVLADGQSVVIGDKLESNGAGLLQKVVMDSTGIYYNRNIIGVAMEAKDMSGSAGVDPTPYFEVMVA